MKKFMIIYKIVLVYIKLNNISSTDLYWIKCKGTDDNTNTESKFKSHEINRRYSHRINCGYNKIATFDEEDLDYYLEELSIKRNEWMRQKRT